MPESSPVSSPVIERGKRRSAGWKDRVSGRADKLPVGAKEIDAADSRLYPGNHRRLLPVWAWKEISSVKGVRFDTIELGAF